jgi:hypothetical protein
MVHKDKLEKRAGWITAFMDTGDGAGLVDKTALTGEEKCAG